jgi:pimeloyl-ACP methyl ester carboxylesterase
VSDEAPGSNAAMQTVSAGGIRIHYNQTGKGPRLVLLHGLAGSLTDWQTRVVPLLRNDFTVLTYDLRGHGYSDMPPAGYTTADMASDLGSLLDALGIGRVHIAGHSFGGTIALHFATLQPKRVIAFTLSDSRIRSLQPFQRIKDWAQWPAWKAQLQSQGLTLDEESELDFSILEQLLAQRPAQSRKETVAADERRKENWLKLLDSTSANTDLRSAAGLTPELIGEARAPSQAIYGELSFALPTLEALKKYLPGLQWTVVPRVGHFFPITRPDLFAGLVRAFHIAAEPKPPDATMVETALEGEPPTK